MIKELTCIVCPMGCRLKAELDGNGIKSITGNTCPRGKAYAENECINPRRTVTSTVKCSNGAVVPVKTDRTIPKERSFDCIKIMNAATAQIPVAIGDIIIKDVFGANVVATDNRY